MQITRTRKYTSFNPRSHAGSDPVGDVKITLHLLFQSTLPRGERRCRGLNGLKELMFQSTLPRGERPMIPM